MLPLYCTQVLAKSQFGLTLPLAAVALVKLACCCICAVLRPTPPATAPCPLTEFPPVLTLCPVLVMSQKELTNGVSKAPPMSPPARLTLLVLITKPAA